MTPSPIPGVGRRERQKAQKRERIAAAARELFSTKGFAATTTQEIAERADIGTGTLFLYVESKQELLVLVFRDEMGRIVDEAFASLPRGGSLLDQLMHVFGALVGFHDDDQGLTRVFVKELMFVSESNRQSVVGFVDGVIERLGGVFQEAQTRGELDAGAPVLVCAENCFAVYLLLLQRWLGLRGPLATVANLARLRQAFEVQLRGLMCARGTSGAPSARGRAPARRGRRGPGPSRGS